jgi:hypothetical protein
MYTKNIISLLSGAAISYMLCDSLRFILKLHRFGKAHTLALSLFLILLPTVTYIYAFPYRGTLSGSLPFDIILSSTFGVIIYWISLFILMISKVAAKPRFIYCQALFLISSIYILIHMVGNITPPNIR